MKAAEQARDWTIAVAVGAAALLLVGLVLRIPIRVSPPGLQGLGPPDSGRSPRVRWSGSHPEIDRLMDPRALFLPTELSAANKPRLASGINDKFPVLTSPADLKFQPGDLRLDKLSPPVEMPAGPAGALEANPPGNLAMGMGRIDQIPARLEPRQAWVEVVAQRTGKVVLRQALPVGAMPDFPASDWEPVHFSATVSAWGLVGSVVPMPGASISGTFASLDSDRQEQLAKFLEVKMLLGQRLAPGFYRISVGP